jgi:class 3 adenylate cyclase
VTVCASCGAENRDAARFCDSCAAPLAEAVPVREVRKTVTILFCDVTGSTALGEKIDPESLRHVMSRYFETAKAIVERHGGTVEKFIGELIREATAIVEPTDYVIIHLDLAFAEADVERLAGRPDREREALERALTIAEAKANLVGIDRARERLAAL